MGIVKKKKHLPFVGGNITDVDIMENGILLKQ